MRAPHTGTSDFSFSIRPQSGETKSETQRPYQFGTPGWTPISGRLVHSVVELGGLQSEYEWAA